MSDFNESVEDFGDSLFGGDDYPRHSDNEDTEVELKYIPPVKLEREDEVDQQSDLGDGFYRETLLFVTNDEISDLEPYENEEKTRNDNTNIFREGDADWQPTTFEDSIEPKKRHRPAPRSVLQRRQEDDLRRKAREIRKSGEQLSPKTLDAAEKCTADTEEARERLLGNALFPDEVVVAERPRRSRAAPFKNYVDEGDEIVEHVNQQSIEEKTKSRRGRKKKVLDGEKIKLENEDGQESKRKPPGKKRGRKPKKKSKTEDSDDDNWKKNKPKPKKPRKYTKLAVDDPSRIRRPTPKTPEEREALKIKWKEEARARRQKRREQMNEQEREEFLARQREQKRKRRHEMSEEIKEEKRRIEREQKRIKRALLTPEQRREQSQKVVIRRIHRLAEMTEEEKRLRKINNYMSYLATKANMAPEEIERRKQKRKEQAKLRYLAMNEEERAKKRQLQKRWRQTLSGQKRERFLESLKRCYRNRVDKLKQDPDQWAEVKAKWKNNGIRRRIELKAEGRLPKPRRKNLDSTDDPDGSLNETLEERQERLKQKKRASQRKIKLKRKIRIQNLLDSGLTMEEIQRQIETPEQREKRLLRIRVNKAKNILKKKLSTAGAPVEEIQAKLVELEQNYPTSTTFRPYKPRPENWKPIDPSELLLLEEPKTEILDPPSPPPPPQIVYSVPETPVGTITLSAPMTPDTVASPCSSGFSTIVHHHPPLQGAIQVHTAYPQEIQIQTYQTFTGQYQTVTTPAQIQIGQVTQTVSGFSFQNLFDTINSLQDGGAPVTEVIYQTLPATEFKFDTAPISPTGPTHVSPQEIQQVAELDSTSVRRRGRPKKTTEKSKRPRQGARGPQKTKMNILRDAVCEECGNSYTSSYIKEHMQHMHNPNWVDGKCTICLKPFTNGREFWRHYSVEHLGRQVIEETTVVCDLCGAGFKNRNGWKQHMIYIHGEGQKEENFKKCPFCPKSYKRNITLNWHLKRSHHELDILKFECMRCEEKFKLEEQVTRHVKHFHPEAYFVCEYCQILKYSEGGLQFHYNRCPKIPKGALKLMREKLNMDSLERRRLPCEFCNRHIALFSLQRHYYEIHGIVEDRFMCIKCNKEYKKREFWAVHMEMDHGMNFDDLVDLVRKLNKEDRSNLEIKNPKGYPGGKKPRLPADEETNKKRREKDRKEKEIKKCDNLAENYKKDGERTRKRQQPSKVKRAKRTVKNRRPKKIWDEDDEDEEWEMSENPRNTIRRPRPSTSRWDEDDSDDDWEAVESPKPRRKKALGSKGSRTKVETKDEKIKDECKQEECNDNDALLGAPSRRSSRQRKPVINDEFEDGSSSEEDDRNRFEKSPSPLIEYIEAETEIKEEIVSDEEEDERDLQVELAFRSITNESNI